MEQKFDHHDELALEQNSKDIRQIIIYVLSIVITMLIGIGTFWLGNMSARVNDLEIKQATYTATYDAKFVGIERDHELFKEWLQRIEGKVDKLNEEVRSRK